MMRGGISFLLAQFAIDTVLLLQFAIDIVEESIVSYNKQRQR